MEKEAMTVPVGPELTIEVVLSPRMRAEVEEVEEIVAASAEALGQRLLLADVMVRLMVLERRLAVLERMP